MADCGKTEDFIHERERMCKFYENCEGCPATDLVAEDTCICAAYEDDFIKDTIIVVQKWSDTHPLPKPRTYADDFFEKFPKAKKVENQVIRLVLAREKYMMEQCATTIRIAKYAGMNRIGRTRKHDASHNKG